MQFFKKILATCVTCAISITAYAAEISPIGYWKTIDDKTGVAKSIVHITEASDQTLSGKVVKLFTDPQKVCTACEGERHNQPIMGMVVLSGMKAKEGSWGEGEILDPKNGKTYSCIMRVIDNGNKLEVHGYLGIKLLGRTQTWLRVESTSRR